MAEKEDEYENGEWLPEGGTALSSPVPPPRPKRTVPITPLLPVLFLLLGISLVTVAVLCVSHFGRVGQMFSEIQARLENIAVSRAAAEDSCRDLLGLASSGWRYYDGSMYFFSKDEKPWKEAEDTCVLHRAHLTSVTSQKEMEYLSSKVKGAKFWIGLTDQEDEGVWTWVDSTKYSNESSFWAKGEPNNQQDAHGQDEDCAQIKDKALESWNDVPCVNKYKWICKKVY